MLLLSSTVPYYISDSDNIISKGLILKTGAKIGFKIFSKSFSNFFDILQKILQFFWRISKNIGESPIFLEILQK